ncbi:hypothetical protein HN789_01100 [archaeon]|jgi:hypothetical protein|nr:hypothetical protein [archaeon]MBT4022127.1 hypothetical protein [archaeon]MBT4272740.1 hypothetical protein [archaeon]MBT4461539.1 hypothetical protein [archaeon]MBT4857693.1 hypothetical protein [archaeon]
MVDLKDEELNKKLKELKKQDIPSLEEIKDENKDFEKKEESFLKKFFKKRNNKK